MSFWYTIRAEKFSPCGTFPFLRNVVEHEGRVTGFVMGEIYLGEFGIPSDTAAVDTIGVHPDYQRNGVAHMLLDEYKSHDRKAGVKRFHTFLERLEAHSLFRYRGICAGKNVEPQSANLK